MKRQLSIRATMVIVVIAILFVNTLTGVSTVASGAVGSSQAGIPTEVRYYFVETKSGNSGHLDSVYKRGNNLVNVDSISANDGIEAWKVSHFPNGQAVFEILSSDGKRSQTMKYAAHNDKTASFTGPNYWDASDQVFILYSQVRSSPSANFDYGYHGNCLDRDAVTIGNDPFFKNDTGHSLELYYLNEEQYNELSRQLDIIAQTAVPKVIYNGQSLSFDTPPMIKDNRLLVPISPIATAMSAQVKWDPSTQTVNLTMGNTSVRLIIGDTTAYINDQPKQLDVPAQIIGARTLVPLGFISTGLGAIVSWEGATQTATITYTPSVKGTADVTARFTQSPDYVPEHTGTISIPTNLFPKGKGKPISIFVPPYRSGDNASNLESDGWRIVPNADFSGFKQQCNIKWYDVITQMSIEDVPVLPEELQALQSNRPGANGLAINAVVAVASELLKSLERTDVNIIIQEKDQNYRAIIQLGDAMEKTSFRAKAGQEAYVFPCLGEDGYADVAWILERQKFVRALAIEDDPELYNVKTSFDAKHSSDLYFGYLSVASDGKINITPKIYPGDKVMLVRKNGVFSQYTDYGGMTAYILLKTWILGDKDTEKVQEIINNKLSIKLEK